MRTGILIWFAVASIGCGRLLPGATVSITGVVVGQCKINGAEWDDPNAIVSQQSIQQMASALAGPENQAYVDAVGILANYAGSVFSKPDPYGTGELFVDGAWQYQIALATSADAIQDTFTPSWPASPQWPNVHLDDDALRLRVTLWDDDAPFSDDPIGAAEIPVSELRAARDAGKIVQVKVNDQTNSQLLFVGISVAQQ
jgi:hypothetical protein